MAADINSNVNKINFNADLPSRVDPLRKTVVPDANILKVQSEIATPVPEVGRTEESTVQNNMENLQEAIRKVSEYTQNLQRKLQVRVDGVTGKQGVTVIDSESEEVIRQIPSQEMLVLAQKLEQLQVNNDTNLFLKTEV